jgi:hypothetical protein
VDPGWYDDPGGDRAGLRWWDGRSWTSVTRLRSPSETIAAPADLLDPGPGRRPADRRTGLLVGAVVVALIALVTVVLPGRDGTDPLAGQRPGAPGSATVLPPTPAPTTARPVTGRITDRVAGLSYDVLPGQWREWDRESFSALRSTLGYYRVTQENAPNNQTYWANVNSGPVAPNVVAADGDLAATARRAITTLAGRYYPPHTRDGQTERRLTVDGAPAALVRYRAVFDPAGATGYAAKSEQIVVLVVDTGQELPSVLYVSLPDTVQALWASIDPLLASVRILR